MNELITAVLFSLGLAACGQGVLLNPVTGSGGASSGSTSGGTTGSVLNNLGCFLSDGGFELDGGSLLAVEFAVECSDNSNCPCPLACVQDQEVGYPACEYLCGISSDDCPDAFTTCVEGICRFNFCSATANGAPAPSALGGACMAAGGPNSGTCIPQAADVPGKPPYGGCLQAGSVQPNSLTNSCWTNQELIRSGPLCEAGWYCTEYSGCVPLGPGGCQVPDGGVAVRTYGDHGACDYSTECACPLNCVSQSNEPTPLCEAPCEVGGGCPQPLCVDAGTCPARMCRNGFCD
jgi:hypothetical protein